jgi:hypothetical protein
VWNSRATFIDEVGNQAFDAGSNKTAERETSPQGVPPPETRTRASASRTAAGPRANAIGRSRVSDQVPVLDSKISAAEMGSHDEVVDAPPTTTTRPS